MKYKSISYCATYPTVQFGNERPAVEIELSEGEDPMQALVEAKKFLEKFHRETNPHLYADNPVRSYPMTEEKVVAPRQEAIVRDILSCGEIKVLESYKFIAKTNPEFQEAYDKRLHELQKMYGMANRKTYKK